ncbi:MAG: aldehyde:ferredoxin oxidoreductase, partial [Peptococcaceae bacterium]|nr:aldehyde:ferredoxin oxidoreductase [Peptococcaceae bacterium]
MIYQDYIRVLRINLETKKINMDEREDLMPYLGGVGVASKLLEEYMRPELAPLAPEQPIVFAIGALSGVFPVITKTVAMFISPLTGELGETYAGGRLAMTLFQAGFDAIVITGRAQGPTYIAISSNDVAFRNAGALWGTGDDSAGTIIREYEKGPGGKRSIIRIGPAGENLVSFARVNVDRYRHFGRLGLGAVFGSKYLKAISVIGTRDIPIGNFQKYFKVYREIYDKATAHGGAMAKYHDSGTAINIEPLSKMGGLPTLNLKQGSFKHADKVSGDTIARNHLVRKMACTGCPVGCIHIGQFRREFAEGYEYESVSVGYDYELIYALGTFLGISDPEAVFELIDQVEVCGMDAMSTGVVLGWAAEALESGLISEKDTIVPLKFGEHSGFLAAIRYIAEGKNTFYLHLGKGVRHVSETYGGYDFGMQIGGNEMAGYHTGYGSLIGAAVGARHSHLCNGGYSIDQGMKESTVDTAKMAQSLLEEEVERCMLNSLIICLFARKVYDRETVLKALESVGQKLTDEELSAIARRNYATKLRIKKALGFDWENLKLPKRYFETPSARGQLDEAVASEILSKYKAQLAAYQT